MSKYWTYIFVAIVPIAFLLIFSSSKQPDTNNLINGGTRYQVSNVPQRVSPPVLKASYDFAGEPLPMEDQDVRERLDREILTNTFYHSSTQHILKHKDKYFPLIEQILYEEGAPDDLKYIAVAESAFRDFESPSGAKGVWHFMKGTAQEYGLEVTNQIDERYHFEKSTRAAVKFLKHLKQKTGSWTLAAAAYNRGLSGINKRLSQQEGNSFYDLILNPETARYVYRIVALKTIISDYESFGFILKEGDKYYENKDFSVVEVNQSVKSWGAFAKKYGASYRQLKVLNPWLRDTDLKVAPGKKYLVKIPRKR